MSSRSLRWRRGASTLEYALVMALVVGSAMVAIDLLGSTMKSAVGDQLAKIGQGAPQIESEMAPVAIAAETLAPAAAPQDNLLGRLLSVNTLLTIGLLALVAVAWRANRKRTIVEAETEQEEEVQQARFVGKRQTILRTLSADLAALLEDRLTATNVMTRNVKTVKPTATLSELHELLEVHQMHHVLVCDGEQRLLGVVSDRDLHRKVGKCALDLMTPKPLTISSDTPVRTAVSLLLERRFSSLPVVDDGRLTGIVTITDLVMTLQCSHLMIRNLFLEMSSDEHCMEVLARAAGKRPEDLRDRSVLGVSGVPGEPIVGAKVEARCATAAASSPCEEFAQAT